MAAGSPKQRGFKMFQQYEKIFSVFGSIFLLSTVAANKK